MPQYGPPKKRKGRAIIAGLIALLLVVALLVVVVLSRAGVIDGGPFAKRVPPLSEVPEAAGGLYRIDDKTAGTQPVAPGRKYDWMVANYYATAPIDQRDEGWNVYTVRVYGPLDHAKDALTGADNVIEVGSGYCADPRPAGGPLRVCAVNRGSIVVTVTDAYDDSEGRSATDDELIAYATALANAVS